MSTVYDDFSGNTPPAAPAGWTQVNFGAWTIATVAEVGATGGVIARENEAGGSQVHFLAHTATGSVNASAQVVEVAARWRFQTGETVGAHWMAALLLQTVDGSNLSAYVFGVDSATTCRGYVRTSVGGSTNIAGSAAAAALGFTVTVGPWYGVRWRRAVDGTFRGRIWEGGTEAEELTLINARLTAASLPTVASIAAANDIPQAWQWSSSAVDTTYTSGYLGVSGNNSARETDWDLIGLGIAENAPLAAAVGDPAPTITDVDTDESITSTQTGWVVTGTDFDTATVEIRQGSTTVGQAVNSQTATTINCDTVFDSGATDLKYGAATLAVINGDDQEDTIAITIAVPSGRAYVDLGTPNTTAANRITAVSDLASGDQLEISNVVGGTIADVTVYDDATFDAAEGVTAFDVRAWDASDSTWGSIGTQTVGGGGISGSLSQTLGALTLSSAGALPINGALNSTLGDLTLSAQSSLPITGTASQTLGAMTLAAASSSGGTSGALAVTLGTMALSAASTAAISGGLTQTLAALTLTAVAAVPIAGSLAVTLGQLLASATNTVASVTRNRIVSLRMLIR